MHTRLLYQPSSFSNLYSWRRDSSLKLASVMAARTGEPMLAKPTMLAAEDSLLKGVLVIVDASDPSCKLENF